MSFSSHPKVHRPRSGLRWLSLLLFALTCGAASLGLRAATLSEVVFDFANPPGSPIGELVEGNGGIFYGTTAGGGAAGKGTVFRIGPDGIMQTLVEFTGTGGANKGAFPAAALISDGNGNFVGTTVKGGANDLGTVFSVTPAGVLTTLVEFSGVGGINPGAAPYAPLVLAADGLTFYGTTSKGGAFNLGTVFSMTSDGTVGSLSTFADFAGASATNTGASPFAGLVPGANGTFYGTTAKGGKTNGGTVFVISPADGTLMTLVQFTNTATVHHGSAPYGALMLAGDGNFYGTTARGGAADLGTVFQMTPGGKLTKLLEFTGSRGNFRGALPEAGLVLGPEGDLYGTTAGGGTKALGTVFKIGVSGAASFQTLVDFTGNGLASHGAGPESALTLGSDQIFRGVTLRGGAGGVGSVFSMAPAGTLSTLAEFPKLDQATYRQNGLILGSDLNTYGTASTNGINGKGTIFRIDFLGAMTTLVEFTGHGSINKGAYPQGPLVEGADGNFYGTTSAGGASDCGTVFMMSPTGVLTTLVEFTGSTGNRPGKAPLTGLMRSNAPSFYGTTSEGGSTGLGTIFRVTSDRSFFPLVEFTGTGGANHGSAPHAALVRGVDKKFYGTTSRGGAGDLGTVFAMSTSDGITATLATLVEFADDPAGIKGAYPEAALIQGTNGDFFGTTSTGGLTGDGTLYELTPAGQLTTLVEFSGHGVKHKGTYPQGALLQASDGNFYGTTAFGGTRGEGTMFKLSLDGGVATLTTVAELTYSATSADGAYPAAGFFAGSDGNLYSTTPAGGTFTAGTVFRIRLRAQETKEEAGHVESSSVRLRAQIKAGGLPGTVAFEYWSSLSDHAFTTAQDLGSGTGLVMFIADVTGLTPNTTYSYRVVITDSSGTVQGATQTFTTEPLSSEVLATGSTVSGLTVQTLGAPALADNGAVATLATLVNGAVRTTAIISGSPAAVLVRVTDPAPMPTAVTASFTSLSDPVCDGTGHVAFSAKVLTGRVAGAGLWSDTTGTLLPVAVVGGDVPGVSGAHFTALGSYAMSSTGVVFYTGTIAGPGVTAASNRGIWALDATGHRYLALRTGDPVIDSGPTIVSFTALTAVAGSPGQDRGYRDHTLTLRTTLLDGHTVSQAIVTCTLSLDAQSQPVVTRQVVKSTPFLLRTGEFLASVSALGVPAMGTAGTAAVLGTIFNGQHTIVANSDVDDFLIVARTSAGLAPGVDGAKFTSLQDPVFNAQFATAFGATVAGSGVTPANRSGLWWNGGVDGLTLIARTGTEAAEVPGATWSGFVSLALPDGRGPVFVGRLAAGAGGTLRPTGINTTNNLGVWSVDAAGRLHLLVRTGDTLQVEGAPRTVTLLSLLGPVLGSPGQGRGYNTTPDLVYRATFADHTQAIMRIHLP